MLAVGKRKFLKGKGNSNNKNQSITDGHFRSSVTSFISNCNLMTSRYFFVCKQSDNLQTSVCRENISTNLANGFKYCEKFVINNRDWSLSCAVVKWSTLNAEDAGSSPVNGVLDPFPEHLCFSVRLSACLCVGPPACLCFWRLCVYESVKIYRYIYLQQIIQRILYKDQYF